MLTPDRIDASGVGAAFAWCEELVASLQPEATGVTPSPTVTDWINAGIGALTFLAAVAAGFFAWRAAHWTKAQAGAAKDQVKLAQASLTIAQQEAQDARDEAAHQRSEARRATRRLEEARIDATMPTISVVTSRPQWPPLEPSTAGGGAQPWPVGIDSPVLYMPRDADRRIAVWMRVVIRNDSEQHVLVTAGGFAPSSQLPLRDGPAEILPRTNVPGRVEANRTLREWVEIHKARSAGEPGAEHHATIVYQGQADTSANDTWTITVSGTPVEPVPEFEGGWRIIAEPIRGDGLPSTMSGWVEPRMRTYFLSKSRNERLDDIYS